MRSASRGTTRRRSVRVDFGTPPVPAGLCASLRRYPPSRFGRAGVGTSSARFSIGLRSDGGRGFTSRRYRRDGDEHACEFGYAGWAQKLGTTLGGGTAADQPPRPYSFNRSSHTGSTSWGPARLMSAASQRRFMPPWKHPVFSGVDFSRCNVQPTGEHNWVGKLRRISGHYDVTSISKYFASSWIKGS
jgi:hypothetical protein